MDFNLLPNALIIGAQKAATTSLYSILAQHKEIFTSSKKEVGFFSKEERYANGGDWYQNTYFENAGGFPVRIEASPAYLIFSEKVAPRIKDFYQNKPVKFIAIFRDPVQRAYSSYWHAVRMKHEALSFREALAVEETRLKENRELFTYHGIPKYCYFRAGLYATSLKPSECVNDLRQLDIRI